MCAFRYMHIQEEGNGGEEICTLRCAAVESLPTLLAGVGTFPEPPLTADILTDDDIFDIFLFNLIESRQVQIICAKFGMSCK